MKPGRARRRTLPFNSRGSPSPASREYNPAALHRRPTIKRLDKLEPGPDVLEVVLGKPQTILVLVNLPVVSSQPLLVDPPDGLGHLADAVGYEVTDDMV